LPVETPSLIIIIAVFPGRFSISPAAAIRALYRACPERDNA
jgi:hypothetical protein